MKYHYLPAGWSILDAIIPETDESPSVLITELEPDEPVFVLRARDPFAIAAMNHYRVVTEGVFSGEKADDLERAADRMIAWREDHRPLLQDPD